MVIILRPNFFLMKVEQVVIRGEVTNLSSKYLTTNGLLSLRSVSGQISLRDNLFQVQDCLSYGGKKKEGNFFVLKNARKTDF